MEHLWTGGGKILSGSKKREPPHKHSDEHTTTPMLNTCRAVKLKHHKLSCRLSPLTSKYGPNAERNKKGGGKGGGELTSCIWALKTAHEDNWKDCIITWATACGGEHTAHSPGSGTDTHPRTHSSSLCPEKHRLFPATPVDRRWKHEAHLNGNVRSQSCNAWMLVLFMLGTADSCSGGV